MLKITKLEDLQTWRESIKLAKIIFDICQKLPESEKYNLRKHLWECARNIPGNIAEGFGRYHYLECIQFYRVARGSINEIKSDIHLCLHPCKYITKETHDKIIAQIEITEKLINGLIGSADKVKIKPKN